MFPPALSSPDRSADIPVRAVLPQLAGVQETPRSDSQFTEEPSPAALDARQGF